jgi:hypothetical protein
MAIPVQGTAAFNAERGFPDGSSPSISCTSAGICAAVGGYVDSDGYLGGLVIGEQAGVWGRARPVPGLVALDRGEEPEGTDSDATGPFLTGVSCTAADYCALAGYGPLVDGARGGAWGTVREVQGATALLPGGEAIDARVSCARLTGECVVVGAGGSLPGRPSLYVSSGRDGAWSPARLMAAPPGSIAIITALSCAPSGGCLAAGAAERALGGGFWPFVESVRSGKPGGPVRIRGLAALDKGGTPSTITSISCPSAGDCVVGGTFKDATGRDQAFVAEQRDGRWGAAEPVPGLAALSTGGGAEFRGVGAALTQLACGRPGNCAAGGWYLDVKGSAYTQAWIAAEVNGRWRAAIPVPGAPQRHADGTARVNAGPGCQLTCALGDSAVNAVSCTGQGECVAGGYFATGRQWDWTSTAFTIAEHGGVWGTAAKVPGLAALNKGRNAAVTALSCAPAGGCGVIGVYAATRDRYGDRYAIFVVTGSLGS